MIEVAEWPGAGRPIVLLHEGLGSVGLWRGFPAALAGATGRRVIAYSRHGHGRSGPPPRPRTPDFFREEALDVLPALLREWGIEEPLLVGHSDGASIALVHAAHHPVEGLVLMAPHVFVEDITVAGIRETRERTSAAGCASGWRATTTTRTPPSTAGATSGSTRRSAPGASRPTPRCSTARCC